MRTNYFYYIPINDTTFKLSVFWPSDTESQINKLRFSDSVSLSFKTRLTSVTSFCSDVTLCKFQAWIQRRKTWWRYIRKRNVMANVLAIFRFKDQKQLLNQKECQKKAYNKHIIIIFTWSGVQYHVLWMIPLDHPRRIASRVIGWYDLIHSTWYSTPDQVTTMIMCMDQQYPPWVKGILSM